MTEKEPTLKIMTEYSEAEIKVLIARSNELSRLYRFHPEIMAILSGSQFAKGQA
jgi:hypothetical protein